MHLLLGAEDNNIDIKFYYTQQFENTFDHKYELDSFFNKIVADMNIGFVNSSLPERAVYFAKEKTDLDTSADLEYDKPVDLLERFSKFKPRVEDILNGADAAVLLVDTFVFDTDRNVALF